MSELFVTYEDFGAKGDGCANDFDAIRAAHEHANREGLPVRAKAGATYLITETHRNSIVIRTDTDWTGAHIILDDREIGPDSEDKGYIFIIQSDYPKTYLPEDKVAALREAGGLFPGSAERIDTGLDYPALVNFMSSDEYFFIRYGCDMDEGMLSRELILVRPDGTPDPMTPIMHRIERPTSAEVFRCDDRPICIRGGLFTTLATKVPVDKISYIGRHICLRRSNTTVMDLTHEIVGEPTEYACSSYSAFIYVQCANNVRLENCTMQARRYYKLCGSYAMQIQSSNNITLKNCRQTNFFAEDGKSIRTDLWGFMGSNFSKNIFYEGCRLSRYDAHCGAYGGRIVDSELIILTLIGAGDFEIRNSHIYAFERPLELRPDYGSTWCGSITLRDCVFHNFRKNAFIIGANWVNHYFGYKTHIPDIIIDNLTLTDPPESIPVIRSEPFGGEGYAFESIFAGSHKEITDAGEKNENPLSPPRKIAVINNKAGYRYTLPDHPFFDKTEIVGVELIPMGK